MLTLLLHYDIILVLLPPPRWDYEVAWSFKFLQKYCLLFGRVYLSIEILVEWQHKAMRHNKALSPQLPLARLRKRKNRRVANNTPFGGGGAYTTLSNGLGAWQVRHWVRERKFRYPQLEQIQSSFFFTSSTIPRSAFTFAIIVLCSIDLSVKTVFNRAIDFLTFWNRSGSSIGRAFLFAMYFSVCNMFRSFNRTNQRLWRSS